MSRVKITEFKAKSIVLPQLGQKYTGIQVNTTLHNWNQKVATLPPSQTYVVKVDQGVKKRAKNGLLKLDISSDKVKNAIELLGAKGFTSFLVEPFSAHKQTEERYLALQRVREGVKMWFHKQGGIDIEETSKDSRIEAFLVDKESEIKKASEASMIPYDILKSLIDIFKKEYFAFLEINPLLIAKNKLSLLDLAVEVDSAGDYFVTSWQKSDFVQNSSSFVEQANVAELSKKSPSSFSLEVLNKDGGIWMLLSGGGASLVIADEYYNLGKGALIGNYGEYSGAPNADETYEYAKQIISLLLKSKAKKKILLIAGGVANFTDVSITFRGIVRALGERLDQLKAQKVAVYVRRGGPQQEKGLTLMRDFVSKSQLGGYISGPTLSLDEIVKKSLDSL